MNCFQNFQINRLKQVELRKKIDIYRDMNKFEIACKELMTLPEVQLDQVVDYIRYLKGLNDEASSRMVVEENKTEGK